jgi:hypothetical protein
MTHRRHITYEWVGFWNSPPQCFGNPVACVPFTGVKLLGGYSPYKLILTLKLTM